MQTWGFYGRADELRRLQSVFSRGRWFFLQTHPNLTVWNHEFALIAPSIPDALHARIQAAHAIPQDLVDLTRDFTPSA